MNQNINQKKVMAKYFNKRKLGCFKNFNVEKFVNNFFETLNLDCGTVNTQFIKYVQDKTTKTKSGKVDKVDEILFQNESRESRIFSIIHTFGHIDHYNYNSSLTDEILTGFMNKSHFITDYILLNEKIKKTEISFIDCVFELFIKRLKYRYLEKLESYDNKNFYLQEFVVIMISIFVVGQKGCYVPENFKNELKEIFILLTPKICTPDFTIDLTAFLLMMNYNMTTVETNKTEGYTSKNIKYLQQKIPQFGSITDKQKFAKELLTQVFISFQS